MLNWLSLGLLLAVCAGAASAAGKDFDFDALKVRARQQAAAAYSPPPQADGALAQIDPARRAAALLKARYAPWTMASRFVPLPLAPRAGCAPTLFNSIQASGIERFDYRPELFDWPAAGLPEPGPAATGFCGFRLLYPSAGDGKREDLARFEGDAWQLVGTGSLFGAAALAVGVIDNDGRAQPAPFREFWLVRPAAGGRQLRLYALADAPALAAAFQIDLVPGAAGRADVQVALYPREGAGKLLLAPLAGSFVQGEHRPGRVLPLQAEVHSVDGLAIHTAAGGWLWRPLDNPAQRSAYSFLVNTPRGFGLLQRDRDANHYEPDAPQPRQPDLWLVPGADWGAGQLRLLEAPVDNADVRNVLVGFVPDQQPAPGAGMELGYAVQWSTDTSLPRAGGWVIATRSGAGGGDGSRRYAVDFVGPALRGLPPGAAPVAVIDIGRGGGLQHQRVVANPHTGGWRLLFEFDRETDAPLQLRAYLQHADQPLTETWDYVDLPR
jgi:glucans biosynthesis protein